jgi:hypothetical protein
MVPEVGGSTMTLVLKPPILIIDLWLKQGSDADIIFGVKRAGRPITDPTGHTVRAQIKNSSSTPVLFEWNSSPSSSQGRALITYDSVALKSVLTLSLKAAHSALFTFGTAHWDCFVFGPAGDDSCVASGTVTIDPRITF